MAKKRRRSSIRVEHVEEEQNAHAQQPTFELPQPALMESEKACKRLTIEKVAEVPNYASTAPATTTTAAEMSEEDIQRLLRAQGFEDSSDEEDSRASGRVQHRQTKLATRDDDDSMAECDDGQQPGQNTGRGDGDNRRGGPENLDEPQEGQLRNKNINDDVDELAAARRKVQEEKAQRRAARREARRPEKEKEAAKLRVAKAAAKAMTAAEISARAPVVAPGGGENVDIIWNQAFQPARRQLQKMSERDGKTPRLLLPAEELHRCAILGKLRQFLTSLCKRYGVRKVPFGAFERWHFCWLLHCAGDGKRDGLLPLIPRPGEQGEMHEVERDELGSDAENNSEVSDGPEEEEAVAGGQDLERGGKKATVAAVVSVSQEMGRVMQEELQHGGLALHIAVELSKRMGEAACKAAQHLPDQLEHVRLRADADAAGDVQQQAKFAVTVAPDSQNPPPQKHEEEDDGEADDASEDKAAAPSAALAAVARKISERLEIRCHGEALKIARPHYDKLRALFWKHSPAAAKQQPPPSEAHDPFFTAQGSVDEAYHSALFCLLVRYHISLLYTYACRVLQR